jgi:hypothetical protein
MINEISEKIKNSVWELSATGLQYKFQNEDDLTIGTNAKFKYRIEEVEGQLTLILTPSPIQKGNNYLIKMRNNTLYIQETNRQPFSLMKIRDLKSPTL